MKKSRLLLLSLFIFCVNSLSAQTSICDNIRTWALFTACWNSTTGGTVAASILAPNGEAVLNSKIQYMEIEALNGNRYTIDFNSSGGLKNNNPNGSHYQQITLSRASDSALTTTGGSIYLIGNVQMSNSTGTNGGGLNLSGTRVNQTTYTYSVPDPILPISTNVTVQSNLRLYNNKADSNGGGMYLTGNAAFNGTVSQTFSAIRNTAGDNGGGIYIDRSTLTIFYGGSFDVNENTATNGSGGGIFARGSTIVLGSAAGIATNTAGQHGGGLYLDNTTLTASAGTMVFNNIAQTGNGGGLFARNSSNITLNGGSEFALNKATNGRGGAIYLENSTLTTAGTFNVGILYGTNHQGNNAMSGGGIYLQGSTLNINGGLNLRYNNASYSGGGIVGDGGSTLNFRSATYIENNSAGENGGGLYLTGNSNATTNNPFFVRNNTADASGGGLYIYNSSLSSSYAADIANNTANNNGGGIFAVNGADVQFRGTANKSSINNNAATRGDGGAGYFSGGSNFLAYNADFLSNKAEVDGGALYFFNSTFTLGAIGSTYGPLLFDNNNAGRDGGALYVNSSLMSQAAAGTLGNIRFTNNKATGQGGALYINGYTSLSFNGSVEFRDNSAGAGGALAAMGGSAQFRNVNTASFVNNTATGIGGGAMYINGGTITVSNVNFQNNKATATGGKGGAIFVGGGAFNTIGGTSISLVGNTSISHGGAMYFEGGNSIIAGTATFNNNLANGAAAYGGAIAMAGGAASFMANATFGATTENTARRGGAVYVGGGQLAFNGNVNTFTNNFAYQGGGAIYMDGGTLNFGAGTSNSFTANHLGTGSGGALLIDGGTINSGNGSSFTFTNNRAISGGAIGMSGGDVVLGAATFTKNTGAGGFGGAIFINNGMLSFNGNTTFGAAGDASQANINDFGAVYNNGGTINFFGLSNNFYAHSTGALYMTGSASSEINMNNGNFVGNSRTNYGGAVFLQNGTLTLGGANNIFDGNSAAGGRGGAVYMENASFKSLDAVKFINQLQDGITGSRGGALYLATPDSNVDFAGNATFGGSAATKNTAKSGGAVYVNNGVLGLNGSANNLSFNQATDGGGGAVYLNAGRFNFGGGTLANNSATAGGGAVYVNSGGITTAGNTMFNNNYATMTANGGALYFTTTAGTSNFNGITTFDGNYSARSSGGAIYSAGGGTSTSKVLFNASTTFSNNGIDWSSATVTTQGGAIALAGGEITFNGVANIFEGNKTTTLGGALYISGGILSADGTTAFRSNESGAGGAIHITNGTAAFENAVFTGNKAVGGASYGGAINLSGGTLNFNGVTCFGALDASGACVTGATNTAAAGGAAVYATAGTLNFKGAGNYFMGQTGSTYGSALYVENTANVSFSNNAAANVFSYNAPVTGGGAVYLKSGTLSISGETNVFTNNAATGANGNGGALNISNGTFKMTGDVNAFTGNTATSGFGGAVYIGGGNAVITSTGAATTFFNGNSAQDGGAVYVASSQTLTFNGNTSSTGNTAARDGGAVYLNTGATLNLNGERNQFLNNSSSSYGGGAVYLSSGSKFNAAGADFSNNTALNNFGGALFINSGTATFSGDTSFGLLGGNRSMAGGAISLYSINARLFMNGQSNIFVNNAALNTNGGAINIVGGSAVINNASFYANTAAQNGGAVYVSQGTSITFTYNDPLRNGVFSDNRVNGGAVLNSITTGGGTVTFDTAVGTNVDLRDGLSSEDSSSFRGVINKSGAGNFNLYGSFTGSGGAGNFKGIVNIHNGAFNVKEGGRFSAYDLNLAGASSVFNLQNEQDDAFTLNTLRTATDSKMQMGITNASGDKITVAAAVMDGILDVKAGVGTYENLTFTLVSSNNISGNLIDDILGGDPTLAFLTTYGNGRLRYEFLIEDNDILLHILSGQIGSKFGSLNGLSFNQNSVGRALDVISFSATGDLAEVVDSVMAMPLSDQKLFLAQTAPYFMANVLTGQLFSSARREVLDRVGNNCPEDNCSNRGLWAQASGFNSDAGSDENSLSSYKESSFGAAFGYDKFDIDGDTVFGLFGKYLSGSATQQANEADVTSLSAGVYAGYTKDSWEFNGVFSTGVNFNETTRHIAMLERKAKADFTSYDAGLDLQAGRNLYAGRIFKIKPFFGLEGNLTTYRSFNETGADAMSIKVVGDMLFATAAKGGVGVSAENEYFSAYAGGELKYFLTGATPEIEAAFNGTGTDFKVRGAQRSKLYFGLGGGAEAKITDNLRFYANVNTLLSSGYRDLSWNAGIRYSFCKSVSSFAHTANTQAHSALSSKPVRKADEGLYVATPQTQSAPGGKLPSIEPLYFNINVSRLGSNAQHYLSQKATELKHSSFSRVLITAHRDSFESSSAVDAARAKQVVDFLMEQGVPAEKISYRAVGSSIPAGSGKLNRRVEFAVE